MSPIRDNPLVKAIEQKYSATIINELNSRVIFKIQKGYIFDCVRLLKQ